LHLRGSDRCDDCHAAADDQYFGRSGTRRLGSRPLASPTPGPTSPRRTRIGHGFRAWQAHLSGAAIRPIRDDGHGHQASCYIRVGTPLAATSSASRRPDRRSRPLVRSMFGHLPKPAELHIGQRPWVPFKHPGFRKPQGSTAAGSGRLNVIARHHSLPFVLGFEPYVRLNRPPPQQVSLSVRAAKERRWGHRNSGYPHAHESGSTPAD
jgi:hypothetical protein